MGDHVRSQPRLDDDDDDVVGDGGVFRSKDYLCQKCGKGFGSIKALYGHMRVHSKRSRVLREESVQEITRPVPRKRSTMGLNIASFSASNKSQPVVSEFGEVEEAAVCLMMLSRGVRSCNEEISRNDDEKKTESQVFVERFIRSDEFKKKVEVCMQLENSKKAGIADSEAKKGISKAKPIFYSSYKKTGIADDDNEALGGHKRIHCPGFMKSKVKKERDHANPLELGSTEDVIAFPNSTGGKCKEHECSVCFKVFASGQALGGQKRTHCPGFMKSKVKKEYVNANPIELGSTEDVIGFPNSTGGKYKEHECPVGFKVFASGQALGGHKRTHFTGLVKKENISEILDLNLPANAADGQSKDALETLDPIPDSRLQIFYPP